jgi:hypothetical protein
MSRFRALKNKNNNNNNQNHINNEKYISFPSFALTFSQQPNTRHVKIK